MSPVFLFLVVACTSMSRLVLVLVLVLVFGMMCPVLLWCLGGVVSGVSSVSGGDFPPQTRIIVGIGR